MSFHTNMDFTEEIQNLLSLIASFVLDLTGMENYVH